MSEDTSPGEKCFNKCVTKACGNFGYCWSDTVEKCKSQCHYQDGSASVFATVYHPDNLKALPSKSIPLGPSSDPLPIGPATVGKKECEACIARNGWHDIGNKCAGPCGCTEDRFGAQWCKYTTWQSPMSPLSPPDSQMRPLAPPKPKTCDECVKQHGLGPYGMLAGGPCATLCGCKGYTCPPLPKKVCYDACIHDHTKHPMLPVHQYGATDSSVEQYCQRRCDPASSYLPLRPSQY